MERVGRGAPAGFGANRPRRSRARTSHAQALDRVVRGAKAVVDHGRGHGPVGCVDGVRWGYRGERVTVLGESAFEDSIEAHLLENGWVQGDGAAYDRVLGLDPATLRAFVETSQPDTWAEFVARQ